MVHRLYSILHELERSIQFTFLLKNLAILSGAILSGTISMQQSTIDSQGGGSSNGLSFNSCAILRAFHSSFSPACNGLKILVKSSASTFM